MGVTGGRFKEVGCRGMPSKISHLQPRNNRYKNAFGSEMALFRTSEGGMSRMAVSWDSPGAGGEMGRIRGQKGSFYGKYEGLAQTLPAIGRRPCRREVRAAGPAGRMARRGEQSGGAHFKTA